MVFFRGADNLLWGIWHTEKWSEPLLVEGGRILKSSPEVIEKRTGEIEVYYRGSDD